MLQDVESVKEDPHRMRRIGEAAMRECVGREQVAELVVNGGYWNGQDWKQGQANQNCSDSKSHDSKALAAREAAQPAFERTQPAIAGHGRKPSEREKRDKN